jgi:CDP-glycerol glycerophosphotransferase
MFALMPRLSVVVSATGTASTNLHECLASVLAQEGVNPAAVDQEGIDQEGIDQEVVNLEVLVVVAGDASGLPTDPRVRVTAYDGAGDGRNAALALATGDYLAFLDAADTVAPGGYDALVSSLERSGSDLATGPMQRRAAAGRPLRGAGPPKSPTAPPTTTNLTELPALLDDIASGNKVWRRDFWIRLGLSWPDSPPHDDLLVVVRSLLLATAVDVVTAAVLNPRPRTDEDRARIPRREDMVVLADHLEAALAISAELGAAGHAALKVKWDSDLVSGDLQQALSDLTEADDDTRQRIVETAGELLLGAGPDAESSLRAIQRLKCHLARRRLLPELLAVVKAERTGELLHTRAVRRGLRYYGDYPFRTDRALRVPRKVYRLDQELNLRARVDDVWWEGETLHIEGIAYIALLDLPSARSGRLWLSLVASKGGASHRLPVERVRRRDVTAASKDSAYTYDWAGFRTSVDARELRAKGGWVADVWRLRATMLRAGVARRWWVTAASPGRARWPALLDVDDGVRIVPTSGSGTFAVEVDLAPAIVDSVQADGSALVMTGFSSGGKRFEHRVSLSDIGLTDIDSTEVEAPFTITVEGRKRPVEPRAATGLVGLVADVGDGTEVVVGSTQHGRLHVVRRHVAAQVRGVSWPDGDALVLSVRAPDSAQLDLVLLSKNAAREEIVATEPAVGGVTATFRPEALPTLAGVLPMARGTWDVAVRTAQGHDTQPLDVADSVVREMPLSRTYGAKTFTVQELDGRLQIQSGADLLDEERGAVNQRRLKNVDFPTFLARGLRDDVLFESYQSRAYGDNARAVFEEVARRDTGLTCRWVVMDGQTVLPDGLEPVRRNSSEHYEALARSRYVVVPNYRPLHAWLTTPRDQVVVQTWHGAPFKRIGFDNERGERASSRDYLDALRRESARWDYLLSPNPPSTPILRGAFDYDGEMLETGYPRCDMFFRPDRDVVAARVRERLGLPAGKTVVLYAPTMRDDHRYGGKRFTLDLRLDLERARAELGDDHVLMVRRHAKVVDTVTTADGDFARDVSLWPDVNELLLATDVLVTDYSSLMFDFANTGRPMLFFTYDLEDYRDRLRGFYFDIERVPGPLLMTSDAVIGGIRDAASLRQAHDETYRAFVADFCTWDDGGASARLVDRVFTDH